MFHTRILGIALFVLLAAVLSMPAATSATHARTGQSWVSGASTVFGIVGADSGNLHKGFYEFHWGVSTTSNGLILRLQILNADDTVARDFEIFPINRNTHAGSFVADLDDNQQVRIIVTSPGDGGGWNSYLSWVRDR